MSLPKYPILLPSAVALNGDRTDIPIYGTGGSFSYNSGFPSITQSPLSAGGIPPSRADFNGIFHELSQHTFYQQSGGMYAWSENLDYPLNAVVYGSDNELYQAQQISGISHEVGAKDPLSNDDYWKRVTLTLSDAINSTSAATSASSKAVKSAYDRGSTALTEAQKATNKAYVTATNNSSYLKFSNGIISQWGVSASGSTGTRIITLPIAFTTTTYSVVTSWQTTSNLTYQPFIHSRAKTQFVAGNNASGYQSIPFLWFAIGI